MSTGNITNAALLALLAEHFDTIVATLKEHDLVELNRHALIAHPRGV